MLARAWPSWSPPCAPAPGWPPATSTRASSTTSCPATSSAGRPRSAVPWSRCCGAYAVDAVESDDRLAFRKRGRDPVATIPPSSWCRSTSARRELARAPDPGGRAARAGQRPVHGPGCRPPAGQPECQAGGPAAADHALARPGEPGAAAGAGRHHRPAHRRAHALQRLAGALLVRGAAAAGPAPPRAHRRRRGRLPERGHLPRPPRPGRDRRRLLARHPGGLAGGAELHRHRHGCRGRRRAGPGHRRHRGDAADPGRPAAAAGRRRHRRRRLAALLR